MLKKERQKEKEKNTKKTYTEVNNYKKMK